MVMPIVNKANGLLAEFAIFPVEPENLPIRNYLKTKDTRTNE